MKKFINIVIFSILLFGQSFGQQYEFTNYTINDGLSQSVVNCVYQDSRGFLWIGTQNGLNRFDGEAFDVYCYNPFDSISISNNWVYAITEDRDGNLWIGTKGGLNKYLYKQNKFQFVEYETGYLHDVTSYSYNNICLSNGNILINTPPVISFYDPVAESFTHFQSELRYDGSVKDVKLPMLEDRDGTIWVGSTSGICNFSFETKTFNYYIFINANHDLVENVDVTALHQDGKGILWVGTTMGLYHFDMIEGCFKEAQFELQSSELFSFSDFCVRTILEDKNGNLIVGTEGNGLYVFSGVAENQLSIQNYTSENSTIGHNIVQSLMIDHSENLWIGTLQGISKTDLKKKKFTLYRRYNSPNSIDLLGNVIASLYKNEDGILWVGNWGQGLNLFNRETKSVEHFSSQHSGSHYIPNDYIHVIFKDTQGQIWLGTRDGILIYDKPANGFVPYREFFKNARLPAFHNDRINSIMQDNASNYWIGTQNGLYRIHLETLEIEIFQKELDEEHQLSANLIYSLLEDSEGIIWIATVSGLDRYDPLTGKIEHFTKGKDGLSSDLIISLCEDRNGDIWIGTSTYVNRYNKKDSTFTYFSDEQGLPNNNIFEILKDINNDLWLTTGKGLCRYDEEHDFFRTFTLEDGLQSLEFNIKAAYACSDGELLVGGMNGFNSFYPDSIAKNPFVPNLAFTAFYKTKGNIKEDVNLEQYPLVKLDHKINSFTIEFAALEYTNPRKNNYAYKMLGISDEWIDIGNRRFVPFFALQPGEYTFVVKGSNNDGVWNNQGTSIGIIVLPPWWKSIYAYLAYLAVIVVSTIVFISVREKKLKHDKMVLEKRVLARTNQIEKQKQLIVSQNQELKELNVTKDKFFSIIGHDLGNQFHIIVGFSELLLSGFRKMDSDKIETHLGNIYKVSKHARELLENLLTWARIQTKSIYFNPKNFNVNAKILESIDFLDGVNVEKNIKIEVFAKDEIEIFADVNMFLTVFRNLLANAIKFTHENGKISILIKRKKKVCEISVMDNGVGIPAEKIQKLFKISSNHSTLGTKGEKGTGLGLVLCKEFIDRHKGEIWVESELGKGSTFIFTLPLKETGRNKSF